MSYSLDPDQARPSVGPDLVPNCLQRLSADDMHYLKDWDYEQLSGESALYKLNLVIS